MAAPIGYGYSAAMNDVHDTYGVTSIPNDTRGAAIYVAVMIVSAALFLTILKRSGFRAMVAVGRGG